MTPLDKLPMRRLTDEVMARRLYHAPESTQVVIHERRLWVEIDGALVWQWDGAFWRSNEG